MNLNRLFPLPKLHVDETIQEIWMVNRTQGLRAVGGRLYLTDRRLVFVPHIVDAAFYGEAWSADLDNITKVTSEPAEFALEHLFDGGMRTRLRVESEGREPDFFVVYDLERVQQTLSGAVTAAKSALVA